MKRFFTIGLCLLLGFALLAGCGDTATSPGEATAPDLANDSAVESEPDSSQETESEPDSSQEEQTEPPAPADSLPASIPGAIYMENGGVMHFELYPEIAPQTVENFVKLARAGFYDGLTFHRIILGFMAQGGCPDGTGGGNPGYTIFGEFASNGFENNLLHTRGVLSMARRGDDNDSAGSQFFIMDQSSPGLDGDYAAFGRVVDGFDVLDDIMATPNDGPNGSVAPALRPVISTITIDSNVVF